MTTIKLLPLSHFKGLDLPAYQSAEAAGLDLPAAIEEAITLAPMQRTLIPTGLQIEMEKGFEAQIRPRSGLAFKHGITVLNTPGTIDSDYRGELKVILINLGEQSFTVERGTRIAQMIIAPVIQAKIELANEVSKSERGAGGFGSTGTS